MADPIYITEPDMPADFIYEVGFCTKHNDLAKRFGDGSWGCWWECVVEASGDHGDDDFVPLRDFLEGGE